MPFGMNEVKLIISAVDKASGEIKQVNSALSGMGKEVTAQDKAWAQSLKTQAMWAAGIAAAGVVVKKVYDFIKDSVVETVAYNKTVREMTQVTGQSADSISRIIQVGDDWGVSMEAVRTSMAFMNKQGIAPSIDNMAKLADEYVNTADKAAFAEKAVKVLGRGYQTLIPLLALGGEGLRKATEAIDDNLIVTDEAIKASREYEVAVDDLADAFTGLKYTVGNGVIPILTDVMNGFINARNEEEREVNVINRLKKAHELGLISMVALNQASYDLQNGTRNAVQIEGKYRDILDEVTIAVKNEADAEAGRLAGFVQYSDYMESKANPVIEKNIGYVLDQERGLNKLIIQQRLNAEATDAQRLATENANVSMGILSGALGTLSDDYILAAEMTLAFQLALGLVTQAQYDEQMAILGTLGPLQEMAKLVELGTLDISYLKQAMADGKVTAEELEAAYRATGLSADEARKKVLGLTDAINAIPTHKQINIDVVYNPGQMPATAPGTAPIAKHAGANFTVPPGYPNDSFPMLVESGERVIVIPKGGNQGNTVNNFAMNVHTNAQSSTLIRDYNLLKAMAG